MGNTEFGDGPKYKGRGLIQVTGRYNYTKFNSDFGKVTGIDFVKNPQRLAESRLAVQSAIWYWKSKNANAYSDADDFLNVTYRVNGGFNGLDERLILLRRAYSAYSLFDKCSALEKVNCVICLVEENVQKINICFERFGIDYAKYKMYNKQERKDFKNKNGLNCPTYAMGLYSKYNAESSIKELRNKVLKNDKIATRKKKIKLEG